MKDEFTYGELVEVRDYNSQEWFQRYYVATVEFPDTGKKWYCTHSKGAKANDHANGFDCWHKIRKIQKPEPTNKPEPIEFWVGRLQTQVMSLMDRLSKIEDELRIKSMNKPVKKQIK